MSSSHFEISCWGGTLCHPFGVFIFLLYIFYNNITPSGFCHLESPFSFSIFLIWLMHYVTPSGLFVSPPFPLLSYCHPFGALIIIMSPLRGFCFFLLNVFYNHVTLSGFFHKRIHIITHLRMNNRFVNSFVFPAYRQAGLFVGS